MKSSKTERSNPREWSRTNEPPWPPSCDSKPSICPLPVTAGSFSHVSRAMSRSSGTFVGGPIREVRDVSTACSEDDDATARVANGSYLNRQQQSRNVTIERREHRIYENRAGAL